MGHLIRQLVARLKRAVIKPIPPELEACEVCGHLKCSDGEWRSCEKRLATAEFVRTGDDAAMARLKRAHEKHGVVPRTVENSGDSADRAVP